MLENLDSINETYNKLNNNSYPYDKEYLAHEIISKHTETIPEKDAFFHRYCRQREYRG